MLLERLQRWLSVFGMLLIPLEVVNALVFLYRCPKLIHMAPIDQSRFGQQRRELGRRVAIDVGIAAQ